MQKETAVAPQIAADQASWTTPVPHRNENNTLPSSGQNAGISLVEQCQTFPANTPGVVRPPAMGVLLLYHNKKILN